MSAAADTPWMLHPGVKLGPFEFGMPQREAEAIASHAPDGVVWEMEFEQGRLVSVMVGETIAGIDLDGCDLIAFDRLACALHVASRSSDFGQSMGGSLHFEDLGLSILQFETPGTRSFVVRQRGRTSGEALMQVSADDIIAYFNEQTA